MPPQRIPLLFAAFFFFILLLSSSYAQKIPGLDHDDGLGSSVPGLSDDGLGSTPSPPPPGLDSCNGVYLSYELTSREMEFPHVKNVSEQAFAFKATATVLNAMSTDLKAWKLNIAFQYHEVLVSASGGATLIGGGDFPASAGNMTTFMGYPQVDLPNSIDTAGNMDMIQVKIDLVGTQFGLGPGAKPMPKVLSLDNDGFKCPKATTKGTFMSICCIIDPKAKKKKKKLPPSKFIPRQYGDLNIMYDVLASYDNNYQAQVTIDNISPLGRLDNWNLTWEWKRGEFINSMRGAYTFKKNGVDCIYGEQGKYYKYFDFSNVLNCERKPVITDLPPEREKDDKIGNLPNCCKNGTLLPPIMSTSKATSQSIFQLNVFKIPPDNSNRTAIYPPDNWKIYGVVNPHYVCGPPMRVSPTEFPDSSGLMMQSYAIASWQVVCNITRPKPKTTRCCVSFSAYFNDSVVPCQTCACGCPEESTCNQNANPLLLPAEALLIPPENREKKAKTWAQLKHYQFPKTLPCPDHCGVSINWHIHSDFQAGWIARMTVFNWEDYTFKDWFAAIQIPKAYNGYYKAYSFNGTLLPEQDKTIFLNGLQGLNYLMPIVDGKEGHPVSEFKVPGKQQSEISFTKKNTPGIKIHRGDGFPTRVFFNGEECALPDHLPVPASSENHTRIGILLPMLMVALVALFVLN